MSAEHEWLSPSIFQRAASWPRKTACGWGQPYVPPPLYSPGPMFPGPIFPGTYFLSSPVPIFPGSYVPPNFACPVFPGSYVPQYLCSPRNNSTCPIFPGPYVPGVLCSPGPMFPGCFVRRVLYTHILNILWTTLTYQIWTSDNNVWRVSAEWTIERAIYCWNEWIYLIFHFHA